jgi:hypothetical protein
MKIKRIRSGHYSSNDFQDSNKRKGTENKILGYLPRVLFFNAFELGAQNCEDAHIRNMNGSQREHQGANIKHI